MSQIGLFPKEKTEEGFVHTNDMNWEDKVDEVKEVIKSYLGSGYSFICATSFGKDSTVLLAISISALEELISEGKSPNCLHVLHSNTKLENAKVDAYTKGEIVKVRKYAEDNNLPIKVWVASPNLSGSYLVSMIGGRTIASVAGAPSKCQVDLKGNPLTKMRKIIVENIKEELGKDYDSEKVLGASGTRFDESNHRMQKMKGRKESAFYPVKNEKLKFWTISPIALMTTDDVFFYIASVTGARRKTYSDFESLMEIYRESSGGNCADLMYSVTGYATGSGNTSCDARTGCMVCTQSLNDRSLENMLTLPENEYMRGQNDFRNFILANHHDQTKRCWISRRVNEDGTIGISPIAYSPEFCFDLLKYALTIDAIECEVTFGNPRFQLLSLQDIIGIDLLFNRYSYHQGMLACATYHEIFNLGKRYTIPKVDFIHPRKPIPKTITVPFADEEYNEPFSGFRDISMAAIDQESVIEKKGELYNDVNTGNEFSVDAEGACLFFDWELEDALDRYHYSGDSVFPRAAIDYFFRLGVVEINKGGHSEWDRMLRVGSQVHRHGIRKHLNNPQKLIEILSKGKQTHLNGQQDLIFQVAV